MKTTIIILCSISTICLEGVSCRADQQIDEATPLNQRVLAYYTAAEYVKAKSLQEQSQLTKILTRKEVQT